MTWKSVALSRLEMHDPARKITRLLPSVETERNAPNFQFTIHETW